MSNHSPSVPLGFKIIGILKLVTFVLLVCVAFGVFHLLNADIGDTLEHFVQRLHLDPENHLIIQAIAQLSGISHAHLKAIGAGTFCYALLYLVEGIGILRGYHWAEYLIVIATGVFIPLEIYELYIKISGIRIAALTINLLIVAYLIRQLWRQRFH